MNDYETLVRQAQARGGDETRRREVFAELVRLFQQRARQWAYARLGDFDLAEDAAQEAFMTAYQHLDELREPKAFPAWLKRVVMTQCSRMTRNRTTTQPLDEDVTARSMPDDDPAVEVEYRELRDRLRQAIRDLPERERDVTELFYVVGYSQQEIAERLCLPLTTVKKRLQYARERLRETMPQMRAPAFALHPVGFDSHEQLALWRRAGRVVYEPL